MKDESRKYRILRALQKNADLTANEVIELLKSEDKKNRTIRKTNYHTHANKRFAPLKRAGLIKEVGKKIGPTKRLEKIWCITRRGKKKIINGNESA